MIITRVSIPQQETPSIRIILDLTEIEAQELRALLDRNLGASRTTDIQTDLIERVAGILP